MNTINNVPRELLAELQEHIDCHRDAVLWGKVCDILSSPSPADHVEDVRAMVAKPSPAGVDGLEVRAYEDSGGALYTAKLLEIMEVDSVGCEPLCRLSDAQAIIDGLRGEVEVMTQNANNYSRMFEECAEERDQQAQRICELEGLLREVHDTYRAAVHWEDLRGTMRRIDAALSAGKEGE